MTLAVVLAAAVAIAFGAALGQLEACANAIER